MGDIRVVRGWWVNEPGGAAVGELHSDMSGAGSHLPQRLHPSNTCGYKPCDRHMNS